MFIWLHDGDEFQLFFVIFQNGGRRVTVTIKFHERSIEDLHLSFPKNQMRCQSDKQKLSYHWFYGKLQVKSAIFENGGRTVDYLTKMNKRSIEVLNLAFTKS